MKSSYFVILASSRQNWKETISRAHPSFLLCPPTWRGTKKVEGHINNFSAGALRRQFVPLHFWIASGAAPLYYAAN